MISLIFTQLAWRKILFTQTQRLHFRADRLGRTRMKGRTTRILYSITSLVLI